MKIREALTEAIDVSELAVNIYKQLPRELDRLARSQASYWVDVGEKDNPSDPVQGAYEAVQKEFHRLGLFHPGYQLKNKSADVLRDVLREYLKRYLKDDKIKIDVTKGTRTGKGRKKTKLRTGAKGTDLELQGFTVEFFTDMGPYEVGHYTRGKARVEIPNEKWRQLWGEFFAEYVSGNDTQWVFQQFIQNFMNTTVHELTHLVNDILATTHSSAAFLQKGKAYHEDKAKEFADDIFQKVSSNAFHLSRHAEIQAIAAEIAWESVQNMFGYTWSYQTIDDTINDLRQGYYSDTLWKKKDVIDQAREYYKDQPGKLKQLERMWKALLKAVIENIQQYKKHLQEQ